MIRVLVGASEAVCIRVGTLLKRGGVEPETASTLASAMEKVARGDFDLVLLERELLPESPGSTLSSMRTLPEHPEVAVLTREDVPEDRAELVSLGSLAVLWLGLEDQVLGATLVALAKRQGDEVLERLGVERGRRRSKLDEFASTSPAMQRFLELARRVTEGDSALLILGETGVGKERLARSIHSESARAAGPFITVNCGALPESLLESELFGHEQGAFTGALRARRGYFELAHRGTILLDEIGEMPLHLQVKLLRVLEDRSILRVGSERPVEVDVRIMAATNRELQRELEEGRFRADLYYRLAVVTLTVPPLRERREDVPELAQTFLERIRRQFGRPPMRFHPEAIQALLRHDWPGNVRELMNVIERAVLLAPSTEIRVSDFRGAESWVEERSGQRPAPPPPPAGFEVWFGRPIAEARAEILAAFEKEYVRNALALCRGRIGEAARLCGVNARTLYSMMRRHGFRKEDFRSSLPSSSVPPAGSR